MHVSKKEGRSIPPYSKLKEFLVGKYREIVDDPKASVEQRLKALNHLDGLQIKRKLRPKAATSGSFKKGVLHKQHRTPTAVDSRLLGVVPVVDSSLLGAVEHQPQETGAAGGKSIET